jgi:hypothetical protein
VWKEPPYHSLQVDKENPIAGKVHAVDFMQPQSKIGREHPAQFILAERDDGRPLIPDLPQLFFQMFASHDDGKFVIRGACPEVDDADRVSVSFGRKLAYPYTSLQQAGAMSAT